jgi:hypothetical protein
VACMVDGVLGPLLAAGGTTCDRQPGLHSLNCSDSLSDSFGRIHASPLVGFVWFDVFGEKEALVSWCDLIRRYQS